MLELIILGLATWRISYMLVGEQGPYNIFEKLRHKVGVEYLDDGTPYIRNTWGELFTCMWCMSIWIGAILFIVDALTGGAWVGIPFALSAFAIITHEGITWLVRQNTHS